MIPTNGYHDNSKILFDVILPSQYPSEEGQSTLQYYSCYTIPIFVILGDDDVTVRQIL